VEIPIEQQENLEIWRGDPMTRWFFDQIDKERANCQELLGLGQTVNLDSVDWTALATAKGAGYVDALDFCTTFEMLAPKGEEGDDSQT
jgi:hypothetical protein